ncbi:MAG: ABC transporter permease [Chloroflexi bacterium]|nr:ABC transporter permease [Chloroflexota bacterium]MBV9544038.1 ABC transporter permease [Chloroflexota bacterium]
MSTLTVARGDVAPLQTVRSGGPNPLLRFVHMSPAGAVAAVLLIVAVLLAVFAAQVAPFDPFRNDYSAARQAPSSLHWLGTDSLGRDVLTRIIFGLRISLLVSFASIVLGVSLGVIWGVTSGYLAGRYDLLSQRLVEVLSSFPTLILAMLLSVGLGPGLGTVIIAVGVTQIPLATRVTRSVVLAVKQAQFVEAARCLGASSARIMLRQVAPQCVAPIAVIATLNLGSAIFTEAALSFLGVGVPPPTPSLGNMLGGVLAQSFQPPWWLVMFPGAAIALIVLAANLLGDGLRDFLDPKLIARMD